MKNQSFLPALQVFRAIAALMVIYSHIWIEVSFFFHVHSDVLDLIARNGKHGVDFFFVLSGFIICYAHFDKARTWAASADYLRNRILRIYLPYLPISFLMLFAYRFFPSMSDATRDISLVKSVLLVPGPGQPALNVAWTLVYEMFFYIVFVLFFVSKRLFYITLFIWALLIGVNGIAGWKSGSDLLTFVLSPFNLEFILGVCSAVLVKSLLPIHRKRIIAALSVALVILFFAPVILDNKIFLGFLFVIAILLSINSRLNRISPGNLFMVLGNASYSIYLIHNPEISLAMRALPKIGNWLYIVVIASFMFAAACFSGVVYSRIFEVYLLKKARTLLKDQFMPRARLAVNEIA